MQVIRFWNGERYGGGKFFASQTFMRIEKL